MAPSGPPTAEVAVGVTLYRVHAASNGACFYGRKDATWRWDDPARDYGVLYLGRTQVGPFAETLLRRPEQRTVIWSEIAKRRFARFATAQPLRLADLHGAGLGWFGVTVGQVAADHDGKTFPGTYATRPSPRSSIPARNWTASNTSRGLTAITSASRCSTVPTARSSSSRKVWRSSAPGPTKCSKHAADTSSTSDSRRAPGFGAAATSRPSRHLSGPEAIFLTHA